MLQDQDVCALIQLFSTHRWGDGAVPLSLRCSDGTKHVSWNHTGCRTELDFRVMWSGTFLAAFLGQTHWRMLLSKAAMNHSSTQYHSYYTEKLGLFLWCRTTQQIQTSLEDLIQLTQVSFHNLHTSSHIYLMYKIKKSLLIIAARLCTALAF